MRAHRHFSRGSYAFSVLPLLALFAGCSVDSSGGAGSKVAPPSRPLHGLDARKPSHARRPPSSSNAGGPVVDSLTVPKDGGDEPFELPKTPEQWALAQRAYPSSHVPSGAYPAAFKAWKELSRRHHDEGCGGDSASWKQVGPAPIDQKDSWLPNLESAAGRVTAIAQHPTDHATLFIGTAQGGVWRTRDAGKTWQPLTDDAPALAIGAIAFDPANPSIVYAGTGEGTLSGDSFYGQGILKSWDGGDHFRLIGEKEFTGQSIGKVVVDSDGSIYVGTLYGVAGADASCGEKPEDFTRSGLWRSTDGGKTFTQLVTRKYVDDIEIDGSKSPHRIMISAAYDGAYVYDDVTKAITPVAGLPRGAESISFARAKSKPNVVYAGVGYAGGAVYRSLDGGSTFSAIAGAPKYCQDQCVYDNALAVDPTDENTIYLGGSTCAIWKSSNAAGDGATFAPVSMGAEGCAPGAANWYLDRVHPDVHAIVIDPSSPQSVFIGSDGGIAQTLDGGATWTHHNDGLATLQFYHLCADRNDATILGGGMQDNGAAASTSDATQAWKSLITGDGGGCILDQKDPDISKRFSIVSAQQGWVAHVDANGVPDNLIFDTAAGCDGVAGCGDRSGFVTLVKEDPTDAQRIYIGSQRVWRSTQGGADGTLAPISPDLTLGLHGAKCAAGYQFDDFLTSIAIAPSNNKQVYAASAGGKISVTKDDGQTWTDVTKAPLPGRWVTGLAIDPNDENVVYATFSGFSSATPGTPGHVFRSSDAGATWARFDTALDQLDLPFESITTNPVASNIVYVATDYGVLLTNDGGASWRPVADGLPNVAVYELLFHDRASSLIAGTHGRSTFVAALRPDIDIDGDDVRFESIEGAPTAIAPYKVHVENREPLGSVAHVTATSNQPWLSVTPSTKAAGTTRGELALTANATGLKAGVYFARVTIEESATKEHEQVWVRLKVKKAKK